MAASTTQPAPSADPTPRRRPSALLFLGAAIAIVVAGFGLDRVGIFHPAPSSPSRPAAVLPTVAPPAGVLPAASLRPVSGPDGPPAQTDASIAALEKAIGVWSANLGRDPEDFVSAQNLAVDYYTLGRRTGDIDDYVRAQQAVTQGLTVNPKDRGSQTMAALLKYTLHDFIGARAAAQAIYDADPNQLQAFATIGDSALELGDYPAAAANFAVLENAQPSSAITARLAHLASLQGHDADAAMLAVRAAKEASAEGTVGTSLAFYGYLQGYLAFQAGDLTLADRSYRTALMDWPGSYLALEGLAKVRAAQGRLAEAIKLYQQAIEIVPQPDFLAGLGDLYALSGQPVLAEEQYKTVRAIAKLQALQGKVYNRQLVMFDANHGENTAEAVTLADGELAGRKDVYGWDADAWALLAAGRAADADATMTHALALGTNDALLFYHAGMIAHAVGDDPRARTLLNQALTLNPGFDPFQVVRARQVLDSLQ
jgi:tetratricopeptide (TPR) repeat protein